MKFGVVRDVNSLSALMIARDDHDGALSAAPKPRHHLQGFFRKIVKYQNDNERRRVIHNHPSGSPEPSRQDIAITRDIADAAGRLGIALHDHIIVGGAETRSFRAMGLL